MLIPGYHLFLFLIRSLVSLSFLANASTGLSSVDIIPFRLEKPDAIFKLPHELDEISGLAPLDSIHVAAVQDENGTLFVLNVETGKIVDSVKFGGRGDFEGVELLGSQLFVLRSDGDLFTFSSDRRTWGKRIQSERIRTRLSRRCNSEGLASDPRSGTLFVVCKDYAGKKIRRSRAVYSFDVHTKRVSEQPLFVLSSDSLSAAFAGKRIRHSRFKPSAIAVHPESGHLFLLSSPNRLLIVTNMTGKILAVQKLNKSIVRQPEGIAFMPDGSLILASEGAGSRAVLVKYSPQISEKGP
ncbi:MAG: hypothetical protein BMS9Abin05_0265 [Rhodothermia bacterium]|nr:MAG: hypothetical protein BMS9Abin05_0265 [Rhodothermia bacterium]